MPRPSDPGRSSGRTSASVPARARAVWAQLPPERRLAAVACGGLFLSLFLPWYQVTVIARGVTSLHQLTTTFSGWAAFSFVEAAVLLVAAGVLVLLFLRADGRPFHVPGGDGGVVTAAGGWTCVLLIWRMFDKQGTTGHAQYATTSGIEWGIFVALIIAGVLAYAGTRIRLARDPEPPLPGSDGYLGPAAGERTGRRRRERGRSRRRADDRGRSRTPAPTGGRDWSNGEDAGWSRAAAATEVNRAGDATRATEVNRAGDPTPVPEVDATRATEVTPPREAPALRRVRPSTIAHPPEEPATEPLVQRLRPAGPAGRASTPTDPDGRPTTRLDDE